MLVHRGGACWGTTRAQLVDHEGERLHEVLDIGAIVNIHREVHPFVAQKIGNHFRVNSRAAQLRRERVAKIVPPTQRDSKFLSSRSDVALKRIAGIQRSARFKRNTYSPVPSFSMRAIRIGSIGSLRSERLDFTASTSPS